MSERLVIIDGKSVFYRGYYAMPNLSTKDGTPTGGVYGFATMALEVVKKLKPDYVCVAWDKSGTNIRARRELYPEYKANRKAAPPDFYEQIPILLDLLNSLGWPLYEIDDYEADDIMGAFAKQAGEKGIESYLVTSDLDVLQLVNSHTHIYTLKKGFSQIELFNEASFMEKYGVGPHQWVDVKALKGDSSDNIPGVAGIGEKTAIELIKQYDTLDGVYENIELIKPAVKKKLEASKDMAYLSKKLVTLIVDAPITLDLSHAKLHDGVTSEFIAMLRKLEFRALLRQVEARLTPGEMAKAEENIERRELPPMKEKKFDLADFKPGAPRVIAMNPEATELWVSPIEGYFARLSLTEVLPVNDNPHSSSAALAGRDHFPGTSEAQLVVYEPQARTASVGKIDHPSEGGFATTPRASSLRHPSPDMLDGVPSARDRGAPSSGPLGASQVPEGSDWQAKLVEPEALANGPVVGHDLKSVFRSLLAEDIGWPGEVGHDTRVAAFILNSLERSRELSDLRGMTIDMADPSQVLASIWEAYKDQKLQFEQLPALTKVAKELDFPTIKLLAVIEHRGIQLNSPFLRDMGEKFAVRITEFEQKIYELAGQDFNISSPAQLGVILFEKLQLPTQGVKKGKTGYSTGAAELDKLRGLHPIIDLITQYREYTKLKSTYIDALPKLVDAEGKLHTTYNLDGSATGRLSSINPNLQNIPTRTDIGQAIRGAFVPAKGNVFISADYSQFELRLAAVMANDKDLIESFNRNEDIHARTAAEIYGIELADVTRAQRSRAKTVNFGVLYGMSPHGLSVATGMTFSEAKDFITKYFELRAPIRNYMEKVIKRALIDGYVETIFGRRRPTPDLKSSNFAVREAAKRAAINMPIQGTEADLMKLAMLAVEEKIDGLGTQLLQIHDSILVETSTENAEKVGDILKQTMEHIHKLPVKLKVDIKTGQNWGEL